MKNSFRTIGCCLLLLVTLFGVSATIWAQENKRISLLPEQTNSLITAKTETPVLLEEEGGLSFGMKEKEFWELSKRLSKHASFVGIKRKPIKLTAAALFGFNLVIKGKNISWILDGNETRGYMLYADFNADGDLSNDEPLKFKKVDGKYSFELHRTLTEIFNNQKRKYSYDLRLEISERMLPEKNEKQTVLKVQSSTVRRGKLNINNRQIAFALYGSSGLYDIETNNLYFDLDGDGKLGTETRYSPEAYKVKDKYVNIDETSYEFTIERYGDSLSLKPLAERLPDRADLREGNFAPDFGFKDLNGNSHRLSDFRGKVVLLDVWGLWCAPCIAEAPKLAAAYKKLKDKKFEIISLDVGDTVENLQKFIAENQMNWTHSQAEENFLQLYRIDRYPTYFLLDEEGKIISNTLRPGEEFYKKLEELLKN